VIGLDKENEKHTMTIGLESSHLEYQEETEGNIVMYFRENSFEDAT
jgi:hypothetical protein